MNDWFILIVLHGQLYGIGVWKTSMLGWLRCIHRDGAPSHLHDGEIGSSCKLLNPTLTDVTVAVVPTLNPKNYKKKMGKPLTDAK